jgi:hypothetical protein
MKTATKIIASLFLSALSFSAFAIPISVSQSQDITSNGQSFIFDFVGLANSDGNGGLFNFYAQGDYTDPVNETANIRFELLGGALVVNDSGVVSNSVTGLSLLANNTTAGGTGTNQILDYVFSLSGSLLDSLLADSNISVSIANSSAVTNQTSYNDFVSVGFDYESVAVPEPSVLALFAVGLFGMGFARRRKA